MSSTSNLKHDPNNNTKAKSKLQTSSCPSSTPILDFEQDSFSLINDSLSTNIKITAQENAPNSESRPNHGEIKPEAKKLLGEIQIYTNKINSKPFENQGTISDYDELFAKVFEYREQFGDKQVNLHIDTRKLDEFATLATKLTGLVSCLTYNLKSLVEIDDLEFLRYFRDRVKKISELYDSVSEFKATIEATSNLRVPQSIYEIRDMITKITQRLDESMDYLDYFSGIKSTGPKNSSLNVESKLMIDKSIEALNFWKNLAERKINPKNEPPIQQIHSEMDKFKGEHGYIARANAQYDHLKAQIEALGGQVCFP